jgi:hypothetical protein
LIQYELEKIMKMRDAGLSTAFKCPSCHLCKQCLRGPGQKMSMQQEAEQELIKDFVRIDQDINRALAFTADPELHSKNMMILSCQMIQRRFSEKPMTKY